MAIKEKNEAWIELSQTKGELIQTNNQLMEVRRSFIIITFSLLSIPGDKPEGKAGPTIGKLAA